MTRLVLFRTQRIRVEIHDVLAPSLFSLRPLLLRPPTTLMQLPAQLTWNRGSSGRTQGAAVDALNHPRHKGKWTKTSNSKHQTQTKQPPQTVPNPPQTTSYYLLAFLPQQIRTKLHPSSSKQPFLALGGLRKSISSFRFRSSTARRSASRRSMASHLFFNSTTRASDTSSGAPHTGGSHTWASSW